MAREARRLTVYLTPRARASLSEIWLWNAKRYHEEHADKYIEFLMARLSDLSATYHLGKIVPDHINFRYMLLKKGKRGQGHLAVYRTSDDIVEVLDLYHTAEDWETKVGYIN